MPSRIGWESTIVTDDGGRRRIKEDQGWVFGPVEGKWYIGLFWFAIVVFLFHFVFPTLITDISKLIDMIRGGNNKATQSVAIPQTLNTTVPGVEKLTSELEKVSKMFGQIQPPTITQPTVNTPAPATSSKTILNLKSPIKVELVNPLHSSRDSATISQAQSSETSKEKCEREALEQREPRNCTNY